MLPVRLILDAKNNLRAEPTRDEPLAKALVRFLSADLAGDAQHCQALLDGAAEVVSGTMKEWQISGNSYGLTVTAKTTELRALHTKDSPVTAATDEFLALIGQWLGLLNRPAPG